MAAVKLRFPIAQALEKLSSEDLARFRTLMREPRGDGLSPNRFRVAQVEGKNCQELARLLVDTFVGKAIDIALKMLRLIDCNLAADELVEALETTPRWGRSKTLPDVPSLSRRRDQPASRQRTLPRQQSLDIPEKVSAPVEKGHFVDRHRNELIERVSHMYPILDHLLQEQVLGQEQYDQAMELRPYQAQMRFLFGGPLKTGGERAKEVLMSAICIHYPSLVQELWKKEG
uniref:Pyrin domain-containing protein n=1 Tax=Neogobius melanostomus TaxID=47308 RepID=A0A8C6SQ91_9GOBI